MKQYSKAGGAGIGGALALVIVFALSQAGMAVTPELAGAITLICGVIGTYAAPKNSYE